MSPTSPKRPSAYVLKDQIIVSSIEANDERKHERLFNFQRLSEFFWDFVPDVGRYGSRADAVDGRAVFRMSTELLRPDSSTVELSSVLSSSQFPSQHHRSRLRTYVCSKKALLPP